MISASSFWGGIEEMVLRIAAGILDRAVCHLRLGSIAGLVLLCGSLSGWIGPVAVAQAEEALPDGRVFEMVTPPEQPGRQRLRPIRVRSTDQPGCADVLSVSGGG